MSGFGLFQGFSQKDDDNVGTKTCHCALLKTKPASCELLEVENTRSKFNTVFFTICTWVFLLCFAMLVREIPLGLRSRFLSSVAFAACGSLLIAVGHEWEDVWFTVVGSLLVALSAILLISFPLLRNKLGSGDKNEENGELGESLMEEDGGRRRDGSVYDEFGRH